MGFSHSLLSPQAWVFLRCELGGSCIRAELAEGEVCQACARGPGPPQPRKEGDLLGHHTPPLPVQVRTISEGNVPGNSGQSGAGSGPGAPRRSRSGRRSSGELGRECPAETHPRLPSELGGRLWVETPAVPLPMTGPLGAPCTPCVPWGKLARCPGHKSVHLEKRW